MPILAGGLQARRHSRGEVRRCLGPSHASHLHKAACPCNPERCHTAHSAVHRVHLSRPSRSTPVAIWMGEQPPGFLPEKLSDLVQATQLGEPESSLVLGFPGKAKNLFPCLHQPTSIKCNNVRFFLQTRNPREVSNQPNKQTDLREFLQR